MEERKVENIKNPAVFWQPPETYCLNTAISEFLSSKSGNFGTFFSQTFLESVALDFCFCWQVPKFTK
jgi:hypothetical protein